MPGGTEQWDRAAARSVSRPYLDPMVADAKRRAHLELLDRWVGDVAGRVILKTDLWEEGVAGDELLFALAARGADARGIDVSPTVVERARARAPEEGAGVSVASGDVGSIPMADGAADVVLSTSTLDHLDSVAEQRAAVREMWRVLRPGGLLVLTFDNADNVGDPLLRVASRLGAVPFPLGASVSLAGLEELVAAAGFEVLDRTHLVFAPRVVATALVRLLRALPRSDRSVAALLRRWDRLGARHPRRMGCFVAVLARRPE